MAILSAAAVLVGVFLFLFDRRRQVGPSVFAKSRHDQDQPIKITALRSRHPHTPLQLTWGTFTRGMELLKEQIHAAVPEFQPQLIVGVNHGGIMIASALSATFREHTELGLLRFGSAPERRPRQELLPPPRSDYDNILVVDTEFKTGTSLERAGRFLRDTYPVATIKLAVLVACQTIYAHDLKYSGVKVGPEYLPHFVAYYTSGDIDRPWMIK